MVRFGWRGKVSCETSRTCLLYIFFPNRLTHLGYADSMVYASRFTCVDYFHWMYEVVRYLFVGTAAVHIIDIKNMREASTAAMTFIVAILCESLMHLGLTVETYFSAEGDRRCIKSQCLRNIKYKLLPYIAIIVSALAVEISFHLQDSTDKYKSGSRRLAEDGYGNGSNTAAAYQWDYGDLPMTLLAIGYVVNLFLRAFVEWRAIAKSKLDIRKTLVPANVEMMIVSALDSCVSLANCATLLLH